MTRRFGRKFRGIKFNSFSDPVRYIQNPGGVNGLASLTQAGRYRNPSNAISPWGCETMSS